MTAAERCGPRHHPDQATCGAIVLLMAAAFVAVTAARALRGAVPAAACRRRGGGSAAAPSTAPAAFRWGVGRAIMASEAAPGADGACWMPLRPTFGARCGQARLASDCLRFPRDTLGGK